MARPYPPDPEESGFLEPPRRRPPTAVGTATPPPRRPYRPGNYRGFRSRVRIAAYSILGASLGSCTLAAFATLTPIGLVVGCAALAGTTAVGFRIRESVLDRRHRSERQHGSRAA
ncbi:MAG TPA: hypothetical protein VJ867_02200 [Gemmatimonadaceae bacterium]|nr:hypothetical protein [Gemmatimonadaceae bacterium]